MIDPSKMKFPLGRLVITPAALSGIPPEEIYHGINCHVCGLWGAVADDARAANDNALRTGSPLLSVYHTPEGMEFRVLTTGDRSTTTVHLVGED